MVELDHGDSVFRDRRAVCAASFQVTVLAPVLPSRADGLFIVLLFHSNIGWASGKLYNISRWARTVEGGLRIRRTRALYPHKAPDEQHNGQKYSAVSFHKIDLLMIILE
jgi:hypothetical protein